MSGTNTLQELVINKQLGNEEWANVYHIAVATGADAEEIAEAVVLAERVITATAVTFTNYILRPFPGPGEGTVYPLGVQGGSSVGALLPLFNVLRIDYPAPTGRPSRKYMRAVIGATQTSNGLIASDQIATLRTVYLDQWNLIPAGAMVDVDGQALGQPRIFQTVGMRQLKRGSKRPTTP